MFLNAVNETIHLPCPTYNKSAADDFENKVTETWTISIKDSLIVK